MANNFTMTRDEAIGLALSRLDGPVPIDEFVRAVLQLWPSRAKRPESTLKSVLRSEYQGKSLVIDGDMILPIGLAMQGIRWRIELDQWQVERGVLEVIPALIGLTPGPFYALSQPEFLDTIDLEDDNGQLLDTNVRRFSETQDSPFFGPTKFYRFGLDISSWLLENNAQPGDAIVLSVVDFDIPRYSLRLERQADVIRQKAEIEARNRAIAEQFWQQLERSNREYIWLYKDVPMVLTHTKDPSGPAPDHWQTIIERDDRMRCTDVGITYADTSSPLDELFHFFERKPNELDSIPEIDSIQEIDSTQSNLVFSFKASLKYRKGLWRRIEILGNQTLFDLDQVLRKAFLHDMSDHLSGFWKRIRRGGKATRYREVDLGSINPFGAGEAADLRLDGLGLSEGDQLKYVYDFGDWIEHILELEQIDEPDSDAEYPRVVAQNQIRHRYCQSCKREGKQTVATQVCYDCSDDEGREVIICEACAEREHDDHYLDSIVY